MDEIKKEMKHNYEQDAFERLRLRHPEVRKNGMMAILRPLIEESAEWSGETWKAGFIPDAARLEGNTLTLYEIVRTHRLTEEKLSRISYFATEVYDCLEILIEVFVTDEHGENERRVFTSKDDIAWPNDSGELLTWSQHEELLQLRQ